MVAIVVLVESVKHCLLVFLLYFLIFFQQGFEMVIPSVSSDRLTRWVGEVCTECRHGIVHSDTGTATLATQTTCANCRYCIYLYVSIFLYSLISLYLFYISYASKGSQAQRCGDSAISHRD